MVFRRRGDRRGTRSFETYSNNATETVYRLAAICKNVVQLLESENSRHGFRYFLFEGTAQPEINYLREVVDELMQVIEEEVSKRPTPRLGSRGGVMKLVPWAGREGQGR